MDLMFRDNYTQPYLRGNALRVAVAAVTAASLVVSLIIFLTYGHTLPFIVSLIPLSVYMATHLSMFITAFKDYGFLFMLYVLIMSLFFCSLISLAGSLGILKNLLRRLLRR